MPTPRISAFDRTYEGLKRGHVYAVQEIEKTFDRTYEGLKLPAGGAWSTGPCAF